MESCGMSFIKFLLILFNGVFVVLGVIIIAMAVVDMGVLKEYSSMEDMAPNTTDILLIVIGVLIIIIAGLGFVGAIKENVKLLYIFAGALLVIILLELSVGIAAAALRPQIEKEMKSQLRNSFIKRSEPDTKAFWDKLQTNLGCCGVMGPGDYVNEVTNVALTPASCCEPAAGSSAEEQDKLRSSCLNKNSYYRTGCEEKIFESVHGAGIAVIVTGILFCFIEIAGIIFALWLAQSIKNHGKTNETA